MCDNFNLTASKILSDANLKDPLVSTEYPVSVDSSVHQSSISSTNECISSDCSDSSSSVVYCVCSCNVNSGFLLQFESCCSWTHAKCVGIPHSIAKNLPFSCPFGIHEKILRFFFFSRVSLKPYQARYLRYQIVSLLWNPLLTMKLLQSERIFRKLRHPSRI